MKENDIKDYNIHVLYTSLAKALVNEKKKGMTRHWTYCMRRKKICRTSGIWQI